MKTKKDNLQPSSEIPTSTEKVQRLTGEQESNKPDTNIPHPTKLKCSQCKNIKDVTEFYPSKQYPKRGYGYRCIECCQHRALDYHYDNREKLLDKWKIKRDNLTQEQKEDIANKSKNWYRKDIRKRLLWRAKDRSNRLGLDCNLTVEDIVIPEKCPLLEIPFKYGSKHDKWFTYSIDRIDNTKGYIKGNIQIISYLANTMKSQAAIPQLITFAKNILIQFKDEDIV